MLATPYIQFTLIQSPTSCKCVDLGAEKSLDWSSVSLMIWKLFFRRIGTFSLDELALFLSLSRHLFCPGIFQTFKLDQGGCSRRRGIFGRRRLGRIMRRRRCAFALRPYPKYSRANSYHWSHFPPRRARPGPGPHSRVTSLMRSLGTA